MNALPLDVSSKMWVPEMSFPNALQAEGTEVDAGSRVIIIKEGSRMPDDISVARVTKLI